MVKVTVAFALGLGLCKTPPRARTTGITGSMHYWSASRFQKVTSLISEFALRSPFNCHIAIITNQATLPIANQANKATSLTNSSLLILACSRPLSAETNEAKQNYIRKDDDSRSARYYVQATRSLRKKGTHKLQLQRKTQNRTATYSLIKSQQ